MHRRAQAGDERAMEALYWSMLPLIQSRVARLLARDGAVVGEWYDRDDLIQDAYLVFHRFVMACDPEIPLYRLVAGAFDARCAAICAATARCTANCASSKRRQVSWRGARSRADGPRGIRLVRRARRSCRSLRRTPSVRSWIWRWRYTGREVAARLLLAGCAALPAAQMRRHLAVQASCGERALRRTGDADIAG
jgi:hypothetical protein